VAHFAPEWWLCLLRNSGSLCSAISSITSATRDTAFDEPGKGLASKIVEYSIPFLKSAGVQQYILEVLEEISNALSVYSKQGFVVSQRFDCFRTNTSDWKLPAAINDEVILTEIDFAYQSEMETMLDFNLSW